MRLSQDLSIVRRWKSSNGAFDPSTLVPGIFASKTDGNDADDGLTEATAKETLDPGIEAIDSANAVVGLYYGDEWKEQYDPDVDGIKLIPYGTPANGLPVISGMDVITGWTLKATYTYVYEKAITHSIGNSANYNWLMVAEIDETSEVTAPWTSYNFLKRVDSVAECEAEAGTYYCPTGFPSPHTLQIHPSDSGNPNSNGKRYEVTTREFALDSYKDDNVVLYKLILKASGDGYGQAPLGSGAWVQQCLILGAGTHSMVIKDATIDQCVFIDGPENLVSPLDLTFYADDGSGRECVLKNSVFFNDHHVAMYQHISTGFWYDKITIQNTRFYGGNRDHNMIGTDNTLYELVIEGCLINEVTAAILSGAQVITVRNCIIQDLEKALLLNHPNNPTQTVTFENCLIDLNSAGYLDAFQTISTATVTIQNCIINLVSTAAGASARAAQAVNNYDDKPIYFYNNIVICEVNAGNYTRIFSFDQGGVSGQMVNGAANNNTYIKIDGDHIGDITWWGINPTLGDTGYGNYKNKSGQDANSLYYDYKALGLTRDDLFEDYSNGDWRLKDNAHGNAIAALGGGLSDPLTRYPDVWTKEQAVTKMIAGDLATETVWG